MSSSSASSFSSASSVSLSSCRSSNLNGTPIGEAGVRRSNNAPPGLALDAERENANTHLENTAAGANGGLLACRTPTLLPKEQIHRYLDQCVPPELVKHQRATDGRVLLQLCEEVVQLGPPEAWRTRLPENFFEGSVEEKPAAENRRDGGDAAATPASIFDKPLYCSEDVPANWERELHEVKAESRTENRTASNVVPWSLFTRHWHHLMKRLLACIARRKDHFPTYILPLRLQARVTPILYAWATHWPLIQADLVCWLSVVQCFHAACGAHGPPRQLSRRESPSTFSLPVAAATESLTESAAAVESPNIDAAELHDEISKHVKASFTLPWKPLAALFRAVLEPHNTMLTSWLVVLSSVEQQLPGLCRRAAPFFAPEAVEGLWGHVASDLTRTSDGAKALSLWVHLVPYRHLCDTPHDTTTSASSTASAGSTSAEAASIAAPLPRAQLTPLAKCIVNFLLVEAAGWNPPPPQSIGDPKLAEQTRRGRRNTRAQRLLLPWRNAVMSFVGRLAKAHPGLVGLDDYAEPLFTAWLRALALPVGNTGGLTGATAAAAVSRLVRGAATGSKSGLGEAKSNQIGWTAVPYAQLLNAFPDHTESPLWRQLERWIHATSVLVRPGMPCTPGSAAERVCVCYARLAREALRRVPRERRTDVKHKRGRSAASLGRVRDGDEAVENVVSELPSDEAAGGSGSTDVPRTSARYWSASTTDRFVQLFLPSAVSAFQARAGVSVGLLVHLLYLSPTIALPALLKCVDTGLQSPTEVAAQRRISTSLLTQMVTTVFTDTHRFTVDGAQSTRDSVVTYLLEVMPLLFSFVNPSAPENGFPVLRLVCAAVEYVPWHLLLRSPYEAEVLATEFAKHVIPVVAERGSDHEGEFIACRKYIHGFLTALPAAAVPLVTKPILKEAQNRDHGTRMAMLVQLVAAVSPAEAWTCAEQRWLPALTDPQTSDAEAEWAGALLAACVAELPDRPLVRTCAPSIAQCVQTQLRFLTSKKRRAVAVALLSALVTALMRPRCTPASQFGVANGQKASPLGGTEGRAVASQKSIDYVAEASSPSRSSLRAAREVGAATDARIHVEWPEEADVRVAASFFKSALEDIVQVIANVQHTRVCAPGVAARETVTAEASSFLYRRFIQPSSTSAAADGQPQAACASETATNVTAQTVLEGTLDWLLRLLEVFEWIYVRPSPPVTPSDHPTAAAAKRGVPWWHLNPRAQWNAVKVPDECQPCYSRANLFQILYLHVCVPMVHHYVLQPLDKVGVDLRPFMAPVGLTASVSSSASSSGVWREGESVAAWSCVAGLLRWLVSSKVECPQHRWRPSVHSFRYWSRVASAVPSSSSRKLLPLSAWAERSTVLQLEASMAGYLAVSQETLSYTAALLQCMSFSPHKAVRQSSLTMLQRDTIISSLNTASLALFHQRQAALAAVVVRAWETMAEGGARAEENQERPTAAEEAARATSPQQKLPTANGAVLAAALTRTPTAASPSTQHRQQVLHIFQEALKGTQGLFASSAVSGKFTYLPWVQLQMLEQLLRFPVALSTVLTTALLPFMERSVATALQVVSASPTQRAPAYTEELIELAGTFAAAHPTRAVLVLKYAEPLYWPSPRRWVSLKAVRQLTRMSTSSHVEVRLAAVQLLGGVAVQVTPRQECAVVRLTSTAAAESEGGRDALPPASFSYSETARLAFSEEQRRVYETHVREVQTSLERLTRVFPLLPHCTQMTGQTFMMSTAKVPRSAALASQLPIVTREELEAPRNGVVLVPDFVATLARDAPSDADAYRRQWCALLIGGTTASSADVRGSPNTTGAASSITSSPAPAVVAAAAAAAAVSTNAGQRVAAVDATSVPHSWAWQIFAFPVERQLRKSAREPLPLILVRVLASVQSARTDASSTSSAGVAELLMGSLLSWAEQQLLVWLPPRHICKVPAEAPQSEGGEAPLKQAKEDDVAKGAAAGAASESAAAVGEGYGSPTQRVEEDEMLRVFNALIAVAAAAVLATVPSQTPNVSKETDEAAAALRKRSINFLVSVITCVCTHAVVPHSVSHAILFVGCVAVQRSLTTAEVWSILSSVAAPLNNISDGSKSEDEKGGDEETPATPSAASPSSASENAAAPEEHHTSDTWSQQQLRLMTFILFFVQMLPPNVLTSLLPQMVDLVLTHAHVYFSSPADQVRRAAAQLIIYMLRMSVLHSDDLEAFRQCRPSVHKLLTTLLKTVSVQVFEGQLPVATVVPSAVSEIGRPSSAVNAATPPPLPPLPPPSHFASPTTQDANLLTTMALCFQHLPLDVLGAYTDDMLRFLCYSLDLSFTKVQHLHETAEAAVESMVRAWMPKADTHRLLQHLCRICTGSVPYGTSRRSKAACPRALSVLIFRNLHRIGKYATMIEIGDAALTTLACRDAGVRAEGSQLFAVLTKVASEAQARVLVQVLAQELRQLTRQVTSIARAELPPRAPLQGSSNGSTNSVQAAAAAALNVPEPAVYADLVTESEAAIEFPQSGVPASTVDNNSYSSNASIASVNHPTASTQIMHRRMAIAQALGAAVLADPGTPSPYVPMLMEVLATCAREGNTECGRFAKRVFEQWWHAHREGWKQEYAQYFTSDQVSSMSDLLLAPGYYA